MENYYRVVARVGHFKKGYYALKSFFVKAENGRHAAERVRYMPRVKHDNKYAVESVEVITYEEYKDGRAANSADVYFNVHNKQEQRACGVNEELYVCEGYDPRRRSYNQRGDGTRGKMSEYNKKRYVNRYMPHEVSEYEDIYGVCC